MTDFHRLDARADARFLDAGVADPLTGVRFRPTNQVVICRTCGLVSLRETWEALGGCPNGHDTPGTWSVAGALSAGDGAAGSAPPAPRRARPAAKPPERKRSFVPWGIALGVAALLVGVLVGTGLLADDDEPVEIEETPVVVAPSGPEAVSLDGPGVVDGELTAADATSDEGRYRDLYTFAADSSGAVLTFLVTSTDIYPDVLVETPDGERVPGELIDEDDDTGARVVSADGIRGPGLYRIVVSSRQPGETGAYSLRLRTEAPSRSLSAGGSATTAQLGQFSELADGFYRDRFRFSGADGREHTITVRSSAFAPVVEVRGPSGAVRGETGRAGGVVTFVFTPSRSGSHTLVVSSRNRRQTGAYSVQLAVADAEPEAQTLDGGTLRGDGRAVSDSLAAGDSRSYRLSGNVGDRVLLEVRANGFTPSLTLVGPDGTRTPASPDGDRARLRLTLPSEGTYRVLVGAAGGGGEYRVTLEQQPAVTSEDIPRLPGVERPGEPAPPPADAGSGTYRPAPIDGAP